MAASSATPSVLSFSSVPKIISKGSETRVIKIASNPKPVASLGFLHHKSSRNPSSSIRLNAGLTDIEPDLNEDKRDPWSTNGIDIEDFVLGSMMGTIRILKVKNRKPHFLNHYRKSIMQQNLPLASRVYCLTYLYITKDSLKSHKLVLNILSIVYCAGLISWLFLPAVTAGLAFNVPGEYLYIGAGIFVVIFCIIEMDKPDQPHNFEPQIYNMERGARDKLIADYNTMDIWDFNEKYGELWDFTVNNEDIVKYK
ncbi:hypothetical protein C5167_043961 [Papaver somniferum]|uniref:Photosynthetic NDH subunit of subcomplex B 5, chloroplastic n=1 Tax=Papaver somniferum TaxID=3469 RepID=A0A4Y7L8S3_PAPSO|nr:hypothetical protein C5167_043961 [Papaver somniferum]